MKNLNLGLHQFKDKINDHEINYYFFEFFHNLLNPIFLFLSKKILRTYCFLQKSNFLDSQVVALKNFLRFDLAFFLLHFQIRQKQN